LSKEKPIVVSRRRRRPSGRGSTWLGRILFLLGGIVGTLFYLEVREVGFEAAVHNLQAYVVGQREESISLQKPLSGGRVVEAVDADTRPIHQQDIRWEAAIVLAEEGAKQRTDALFEHYEGAGDPFLLREQSRQAFDKLSKALLDLHAMREEYSHSPSSRIALDFQIARFEKIVESMNEKNHRR
jgi:hypothetical protein